MEEDIKHSVKNAGDEELSNKLSDAYKYYREEYSPYFDSKIGKIASDKANRELLHNSLLQDTASINKVIGDLPQSAKKGIAFLKFKNAIKQEPLSGEYQSNPEKLFNSYNSLSDVQKNKIFTKSEQEQFRKLGFLVQASKGNKSSPIMGAVASLATGGVPLPIIGRSINSLLTNPKVRNKVVNAISSKRFANAPTNRLLTSGVVGTSLNSLNQ